MTAVARLAPDESWILVAPFEPVPLYRVMEMKGYRHSSRQLDGGIWEILFAPAGKPVTPYDPVYMSTSGVPVASPKLVEVDARGLEPPQPMVRILEALSELPESAELIARTDRRPMHLYAHLEERGFRADTKEQSNGSFITHIRRF